jgi:hypothetical protein
VFVRLPKVAFQVIVHPLIVAPLDLAAAARLFVGGTVAAAQRGAE